MNDAARQEIPFIGDCFEQRVGPPIVRIWHFDFLGELHQLEWELMAQIVKVAAGTWQCRADRLVSPSYFEIIDIRRKKTPRLDRRGLPLIEEYQYPALDPILG